MITVVRLLKNTPLLQSTVALSPLEISDSDRELVFTGAHCINNSSVRLQSHYCEVVFT